jgi:hypothetical protein
MELPIPNVSVQHAYHNHITPVRPGLTMSSHIQKLVPSLPLVTWQEPVGEGLLFKFGTLLYTDSTIK